MSEIAEHVYEIEQMGVRRGWQACKTASLLLMTDLVMELLAGKLDVCQLYDNFKDRLPSMDEYYAVDQADVARESEG